MKNVSNSNEIKEQITKEMMKVLNIQLESMLDIMLETSKCLLILDHTENIVSQKNNFDVLDLLNLFVNMKIILVTTEKIDETHLKSFYKSTCSIEVPRLTDEESVDLVNIRVAIKSSQRKYIKLNVKQISYCYGVP